MIQSIQLTNFQSHKKTALQFDKGVNVITGQSDSGKSSIIRALLWVLNNRPSGDAIRNWKAQERDKIQVNVGFPATELISKERHKGKSKYIIGNVEFEAIKQDVPEEVSKTANLTDCNVQTQHEPYFLLNETPGEVARRLNEIVGLDIIDTVFKNLDRRIRNVSSAIKVHNDTAVRLTEEIKEIEFADEFYNKVVALKKKEDEFKNKEADVANLRLLRNQIVDVQKLIEEKGAPAEAEPYVNNLLLKIAGFKLIKKDIEFLELIVQGANRVEKEISLEKEWLECESSCLSLVEKTTEFASINVHLKNLKRIVSQIKEIKEGIETEGYEYSAYLSEYADLLKKAKICPICTSPITSKMVDEIVSKL